MADHDETERIAIVGMAGRFPGAASVEEFWANLCDGVESIRPFTEAELAAVGVDASRRNRPDFVNSGAVMDEADGFDAAFFGMSRREAELTDPQHRVFLECAWAALEHAGYDPARTDGRIGIYGGVAANTYFQRNVLSDPDLVERTGSYPMLLASEREYAVTRAAFKLGLDGPAISLNTACSTSSVAVHLASQSLLSGESDMALAGGARVRVPLTGGYIYQEDGILSPDGHCRAFDAEARGTVAASGAAMVVLKRLSDALEDGDTVYAVIRGTAVNNDGAAKTGFTAPGVRGQVEVIEEALAVADLSPDSISMIEAHGTGTAIGDPIEVAALTEVFGREATERESCALGSLKTNIGHLDAAAGVAGIIKTALALYHEQIPPSLNFHRPNPQIDFESGPFFVNTELRPWPRTDEPRRAGVSSFGLGGTNAHVVLEEPPLVPRERGEPRAHILPLSARTEAALERAASDLAEHLATSRPPLEDVAFTLQEGRRDFERRRSIVAASSDEAVKALSGPGAGSSSREAAGDPSVAFLFPGGGSQHVGMAAGLYQQEPVFRESLDECAQILRVLDGPDLIETVYPHAGGATAAERLEQVSVALPALFSVEYALARTWQAFGVQPSAMIGHSLGEIVAATLAGVFTLESGLSVVVERSRLMETAAPGAMLSVALPPEEVGPYLDDELSLAVVNTAESAVISGAAEAVAAAAVRLGAAGVECRPVPIAVASHSVLMEPVLEQYRQHLASLDMGPSRIPFISNESGTWSGEAEVADPDYWVGQLRNTVRFADGLGSLLDSGAQVLIEVGPSQVLSGLVRRHPAFDGTHVVIPSLPHREQAVAADRYFLGSVGTAWESGTAVDWEPTRAAPGQQRVGLPTYSFDRQRYWIEPRQATVTGEIVSSPQPGSEDVHRVEPEPAPTTPSQDFETPTAPLSRAEFIARRLVAILSELSGVEEGQVDRDASFLELGFDSLFLTQANSQFKKAFGLNITFRQLFEDAPTVTALADHIDANLPSDALQAELAAAQPKPARPSGDALEAGRASVPSGDFAPGSVGESIERTVQQQMALMEEQLALLRSALGESSDQPVASQRRPQAQIESAPPKVGGSPMALAQAAAPASPSELTPVQRAALDRLIERYVERTRGSKEWADRARPRLADNRAVAGFDRLSKEMTYLIVSERSKGAHIWDIDGNDYVDLTMSFGAALLGHSPDAVVKAVSERAAIGYEVAIQSSLASEVAELLCELTGNERVTFAHSGSEAVEYALRMARAVSGRDRVAYFSGDIHGRSDIVLGRSVIRDGNARTFPGTTGIPDHVAADGLVLEYGSAEAIELIRAHAHELAAVLVEPVRTRNPDLQPAEFLRELRQICDDSGTALILDEVVTGFRVANGGAQEYFGIRADMVTYGKALGGGLPIGAVAGRREYLDVIDGGAWRYGDDSRPEVGMTVSGGTMIKHPMALAAAKAVLEHLQDGGGEVQTKLAARAERFAGELNEHYRSQRIPIHVQQFSSFFLPTFVTDRRFEGLFYDYLRERGVHIYVQYPCFLSTAHSDADIEFLLDAFKAAAAEMVEAGFLERLPDGEGADDAVVPVPMGQRRLPLTDAQRDIWVVAQLSDEASAAYHLSTSLRLRGELDVTLLEEALQLLVERHESLRITFDPDGAEQLIHDHSKALLEVEIVPEGEDAERARVLEESVYREAGLPFDLVTGPLFRARLVRLAEDDHTLVLTAHHIISDGWSLGILQRDLSIIYSALRRGEVVALDDTQQFSDYVAWYGEQTADAGAYWLDLYAELPRQLDLPTDHPRPPVRSFACAQERGTIDAELTAELRQLAADRGVTLFTVLMSTWQVLLHRLSGQDDVPLGIFVAGQSAMGVRDLTGLCVNFLPLRGRFQPDESAADYLERTKWSSYEAYDHQHYTVGRLASALHVPRDPSRPMVVSTSITYETPTEGISFEGLEARSSDNAKRYCAFDLEAYLSETDHGVDVTFQYPTALFEADTVRRWVGHFQTLLRELVRSASSAVSHLPLLDGEERRLLVDGWNGTDAPVPDLPTHRLFERQAGSGPERVAVRTSEGLVTYEQLNSSANRLARHLSSLGVGQGQVVGIHLDRSPDMLVALLAVHKAGAAYVPMDPQFPRERLEMIAADARPDALLTTEVLAGVLDVDGATIIALDRDDEAISAHDAADLDTPVALSDPAYIIYTSGSTGRPKGVEVPHVALANLLTAMQQRPGLVPDDLLLAVTTLSFDIAGLELFLPLITGATVVLADEQEAVDALWLRERLSEGDISVMQATPATWQMLLDAGWQGSPGLKALCGGEALGRDLADAVGARVASLWNMYGPTETTIWSSVSEVEPDGRPVPLGEPIDNTQLLIFDSELEIQPIGIPGELYIGGEGLATGYRGRDDLTRERFVTRTLDDHGPRRLYRTGDVVRRLADGRIEFLGRSDHQVKIRGYRIELGEIETVLGGHPAIRECVVVARSEGEGARRLVAYVVLDAEHPASVSDMRAHLREVLPEYMIPSLFMTLDAMPLTANKKVDRTRLPDPDHQRPDLAAALVEPRTETEATLVRIWQRLLGVDQIGVDDSFFDLGGDSLLALRSIMQANRSGMNLTPISIFTHQTVSELARVAETSLDRDEEGIVTGRAPLTPAQLRFLNERGTPDAHHWNIVELVKAPNLSVSALQAAVAAVLAHHDSLRLRLWRTDDGWQQAVEEMPAELPIEFHPLADLPPDERAAAIEQTCAALQASFDLQSGSLLRVAHFECGPDDEDRLFVAIHHFAIDGLTWSVFWEDFEQAYRQAVAGADVALPPKTTSFQAWATQLERLAQTSRVTDTADDWLALPWENVTSLPTDFEPDAHSNTNDSAAVVTVDFDAEDTRRILRGQARPEVVILTALAGCLGRWTGSSTVLMDILSHGRDAAFEGVNLARTVGFTLSYNPLLLTHESWNEDPDTLPMLTSQMDQQPEGFSFELLRFCSSDDATRARLTDLPRADVLFNYDGNVAVTTDEAFWRRAPESKGPSDSPRGLRQYPLAVRATLTPNLRLDFVYSARLHEAGTVEAKAAEVAASISSLLGKSAVRS